MINNSYDEILVGSGLVPLLRGIISLGRNKSVLMLEESQFLGECYHQDFISNLEVNALKNLGDIYNIKDLQNIESFLIPAQIQLQTDKFRLFISNSPFDNIRELIRKFPKLLDQTDLDLLYKDNAETFNEMFFKELSRFEKTLSASAKKKKQLKFELQGPAWFLTVFKRFCQFVNNEYTTNDHLEFKSLIHLLGVFSESKLKSFLAPEDLHFYFLRLLSPVYRVDEYLLTTHLLHLFKSLGGDYKKGEVQRWKLMNNKFQHIVLKSFEGVVSGQEVLFFGHLPDGLTFHVKSRFPIFKKSELKLEKKNLSIKPVTELIFKADERELGTDRPFRVLGLNDSLYFYHFPYPILPGTKPEFYGPEMRMNYKKDSASLTGTNQEMKVEQNFGVTLDLRELRDFRKNSLPTMSELKVELIHQGQEVSGFQYWGVFKYRSFGLLSHCYGIQF